MELAFDGHQDYQLEAIQAVIDLFDGQPLAKGVFEVALKSEVSSLHFTDTGIANQLLLKPEAVLANAQAVQQRHEINVSEQLEVCSFTLTEADKDNDTTREKSGDIPLNFTIEMETGTGKTYVYLRTIYELHKVYGFLKFVIVVPSVAIREGTVKNLQITANHFQDLYDNTPVNAIMYDSKNHTALRNFAMSNAIQILVINIDSFAKESNIINTQKETGIRPIEYIQNSCPIVIVDEPQNMETDIRKAALYNLSPLCTLRYSATHKHFYNLVYSLNPVQAYDKGLVKQIEIDAITSDNNNSTAFVAFKKLVQGKRNIQAKVTLYVNEDSGVKVKDITLNIGDDLFTKSKQRDSYKEGFILNSINAEHKTLQFSGGLVLEEGGSQGGLTDDVLKFQIERTVINHFDKVKALQNEKIKVLSLFFIDKVANYQDYTVEGVPEQGKFARWFEEAFINAAQQSEYQGLIPFTAEEVHNGYFSSQKKTVGKAKDKKELWVDSKENNTKADEDTYSLIMREKERLLSLEEPLQFIFSHSALREGWDNPNVFQICTLNETKSEMKKRQEIGRGLRLPVNHLGVRIKDKSINVLTVIANESYEDFSKALQREIEEETSVDFSGRIKDKRKKRDIKLTKELTPENFPLLYEIWDKISQKTRYSVEYSTEDLIKQAVENLKDFNSFPLTKRPALEARRTTLDINKGGIEGTLTNIARKDTETVRYAIPDVYAYIQSRIDISRNTVFEVLKQSERYAELAINPQLFLDKVVSAIRSALNDLLVAGVKYQKINEAYYEMSLFKNEEIQMYLDNLLPVSEDKQHKTPFNYYPVDSEIERNFARDCEAEERVKFFFKLPRTFKIPTPLGSAYVPDWAIVLENDKCIYFVAETKGTLDKQKLRELEKMKIACGEKHFELFEPEVSYTLAVTSKDL
ncbi:MAG: DEAD/DEAH box helicase family protein [Methylococcaceae bacterium]|nr:DEAD/DEAH box helicase family protein [Methylococcaceae bacterium]